MVTVTREELSRQWEVFAERECRGYSPLYESVCRSVAVDNDLLALVESGPPSALQPNVLLAAVHYLLLGGVDHPLAEVYAGTSRTDPAPQFRDFCLTHRARCWRCSRPVTRRPTNAGDRPRSFRHSRGWRDNSGTARAGRCRRQRRAQPPLRPVPSRLRVGRSDRAARFPGPNRLSCARWEPTYRGAATRVAARIGLDREPIDVDDSDATRLGCSRACGPTPVGSTARPPPSRWPGRENRSSSKGTRWPTLPRVLERLPEHAVPCITTTWSFAYLSLEAARGVRRTADATQRAPSARLDQRRGPRRGRPHRVG